MCTLCVPGVCRGQKRLDTLELELTYGCELPCRFWELNPDSLEEKPDMLLMSESFLQPLTLFFEAEFLTNLEFAK